MGFLHIKRTETYKVGMRAKEKPVHEHPLIIIPQVREVCCAPFEAFEHLGTVTREEGKYPGRHIYIDRGSNVLGVAHLDSVRQPTHFWVNDTIIACPTLDNRLGAWILLYGLPSLGIYPDILLTENEERGLSTGEDFQPEEVKWNWMFSFDRGVTGAGDGTDVVFYEYSNGQLQTDFAKLGWKVGHGSYSDISSMSHLKIEGANIGCGMDNYHGNSAHVKLDVLSHQLMHFAATYKEIGDTKYEYTPRAYYGRRSRRNTEIVTTSTSYSGSYSGHTYGNGYEKGGLFDNKTYSRSNALKITRLVHNLELDFNVVSKVFDGEDSLWKWMDSEESIEAWRKEHTIPEGVTVAGRYATKCYDCEGEFVASDTKWSNYYGHTFCKSCWLERMEMLDLLPYLWREELVFIPKEASDAL